MSTLSKNIKNRKNLTEEEKVILLTEVNRVCPLCGTKLIYKKKTRNLYSFEVAHIYPHSSSEYEKELLADAKRLSDDSEDIANLILLCPSCHRKHDKYTTIEEYYTLYNLKERMNAESNCKEHFGDYKIEFEIIEVIHSLAENIKNNRSKFVKLEMSAMRIEEKSDETLDVFVKTTIEMYVQLYYLSIKDKFNELEKDDEGIFDLIASQIKSFYLQLKRKESNKSIIFEQVAEWIFVQSGSKSKIASQIIASYFVQSCEVLT
ncbi:HNH endonuclease signature motif containing protein [Fusibacter bizertensis]|uniref:HNH endonuclease signature motif containing protein n=1 Tax=Fusibacter bizertensis TaxID=1488331 RepID=A0ABT6NHN3_9FIRM|nr:ABC-three component system protein [Fusibacter bizertensis]MDH8679929.1 HNH endonuclease signature motif containing protein [Fusibacter bizertensis]